MALLGVIGGSGFNSFDALRDVQRVAVDTPYGAPSAPLLRGRLQGRELVFLARHGEKHHLAPHRINYRANLWAMKSLAVTHIVAIATVGGIASGFAPGTMAMPDQLIDYTWGRGSTFFDADDGVVKHIDFTQPYDEALRQRVLQAAGRCGERLRNGGTYAVTQGPRLETAAEIKRLARDGADMVGMTGMPEAALARELDIPYAALTVVVNAAAGTGASAQVIDLAAAETLARSAMTRVVRLIEEVVKVVSDGD